MHPWFVPSSRPCRPRLGRALRVAGRSRRGRLAAAQAARPVRRGHRGGLRRDGGRSASRRKRGPSGPSFPAGGAPCGGEVEAASNYLYSTWGEADEAPPEPGRSRRDPRLRPEPDRPGIEFDYCCVHAAQTFRELGYEAVMVNCNPETVSTTTTPRIACTSSRWGSRRCWLCWEREQPVGRRDPVRRPDAAQARTRDRGGRLQPSSARRSTRSTSPRIASASPRSGRLGVQCPAWGMAETADEAVEVAERVRLPRARAALVRPRWSRDARLLDEGPRVT